MRLFRLARGVKGTVTHCCIIPLTRVHVLEKFAHEVGQGARLDGPAHIAGEPLRAEEGRRVRSR